MAQGGDTVKFAALHLSAALAGATSKTVVVAGLLVGVTTAATASVVVIGSSAIVPHSTTAHNPGSQFIVTPNSGGTPVVVVPRSQKPSASASGSASATPSGSVSASATASNTGSPSVSTSQSATSLPRANPTPPANPGHQPTGTVVDVSNPEPSQSPSSHSPGHSPTPSRSPSQSPSSKPTPTPTTPPHLPAGTSSPGQQPCGYFPSSGGGCCFTAAQLRDCGGSENSAQRAAVVTKPGKSHANHGHANHGHAKKASADNGRHCARRR